MPVGFIVLHSVIVKSLQFLWSRMPCKHLALCNAPGKEPKRQKNTMTLSEKTALLNVHKGKVMQQWPSNTT